MGRPEPLPSPHLPMGRQLLPGEDRPPSEYLSLDTVQAPEPEDLAAAQLHLRVVDLVQPLRVLGDLLFGGAVPSLLQELQGLGRYRGDHLRTGAAKGKTPKSGREGGHSAHLVRPSCSHSLPPHPLGGGQSGRSVNPAGQAPLRAYQMADPQEGFLYLWTHEGELPFTCWASHLPG